jgi:hypothetical protein
MPKKKLPRNDTNVEDDPYKTLALVYNKEMDQLVVANTINNEVEKEDILGSNDKKKTRGQRQQTREIPQQIQMRKKKNW